MAESTEDHSQLIHEAEQEAQQLQERTDDLGREIDQARSDWRAKQADPGVPGAVGSGDDGGDSDGAAEEASPAPGDTAGEHGPEDVSEAGQ